MKVKSESEGTQSCPTLCNPTDCSPPGSSVHGIFQARVLGGVPLPSPKTWLRKPLTSMAIAVFESLKYSNMTRGHYYFKSNLVTT